MNKLQKPSLPSYLCFTKVIMKLKMQVLFFPALSSFHSVMDSKETSYHPQSLTIHVHVTVLNAINPLHQQMV